MISESRIQVNRSKGEKEFPPCSMRSRKLAMDVLLPSWQDSYWTCLSASFQLTPFPGDTTLLPFFVPGEYLAEGGGRGEETLRVERKVFITKEERRLHTGKRRWWRRGKERVQVGEQGRGRRRDRTKDGVLWGFHGWCSLGNLHTEHLSPAP